jgi:adenosylmethionine-8-amino-7-oxononanoate aminotransferase
MNQNPVSCAGAIASIGYVEKHDLMGNAVRTGAYLLQELKKIEQDFEIVGNTRGKGMMCGFEFVKDKNTKEVFDPKLKVSSRFEQECLKRGVSTFPSAGCLEGVAGDMILVTPPLITTPTQIDEILNIMKDALRVMQADLL